MTVINSIANQCTFRFYSFHMDNLIKSTSKSLVYALVFIQLTFSLLVFFFPENEVSYVSVSRTLGGIQQYLKVLINTARLKPIGWNQGSFSKPWTLEIDRPTVEPCMYLWSLYAPGLTDLYDKCNNLFCTKKGRISCSAGQDMSAQ